MLALLALLLAVGSLLPGCEQEASRRPSVSKDVAALTFVVLGDNRPADVQDPQPEQFVGLLQMAKRDKPAFVVLTGDIVTGSEDDPEAVAEQYRQLRALVKRLGVPVHVARGNHDAINPEQFDAFTRRPRYYSFSAQGAGFWILDTEAPDAEGSLSEDQLQWFRKGLNEHARGTPKFVFTHRPALSPRQFESRALMDRGFSDPDVVRRFRQSLERAGVTIAFGGHNHLFDRQKEGSTTYITTGGGGAPLHADAKHGGFYHYVLVQVRGNSVRAELVLLSGERHPIDL